MSFPSWDELQAAALPALLGAGLSLAVIAVASSVAWWRRSRRQPRLPDEVVLLRSEATRVEAELRNLTSEVESRLDAKLDRLEALIQQANQFLGAGKSSEMQRRSAGSSRWDAINTVSHADRNRVLELANLGQLPESIADSVGLLRGEVDLILRLHKSSERSQDS